MSESLAEIAKLLEDVKADLSNQITNSAANLENTFKHNIDKVVAPIIKRQDEYEQRSDKRQDEYEQRSDSRFKSLEEILANLTEMVKDGNAKHFPPLPPPPDHHLPHHVLPAAPQPTAGRVSSVSDVSIKTTPSLPTLV